MLEAFEMWTWWQMENISWMDKMSIEKVLDRIGEDSCMYNVNVFFQAVYG